MKDTPTCIFFFKYLKYGKLYLQVRFIMKQDSENPIFNLQIFPILPL